MSWCIQSQTTIVPKSWYWLYRSVSASYSHCLSLCCATQSLFVNSCRLEAWKTQGFKGHLCSYGCFCSQLPFSGYLSIEAGQANNATITNCEVMQSLDMAGQIVKCLAYTHCCLNPILYVFIGVRFRKDLFSLLQRMSCGLGLVYNSKLQQVPKRPSVMSDTDTTPVFSL